MSRQYMSAGKAVNAVLFDGRSLKAYCAKTNVRIGKVDYALACETIKFSQIIRSLLEETGLSADLDVSNAGLLYVMVYELLFGSGKISGGGAVKRTITAHTTALKNLLAEKMKTVNAQSIYDLLPKSIQAHSSLPKYVRINEIKLSIADGIAHLNSFLQDHFVGALSTDIHIPSLVQLPPCSKSLGQHPLVANGRLIIQDKASCFPSQILMDYWKRGDIIDACAAPGNKTSHMASILKTFKGSTKDAPSIFAFDKNPTRAKLLSRRMEQAGADTIVETCNCDFLLVNGSSPKYNNVRAILVDPSCSGSGVIRSLERCVDIPHRKASEEMPGEERILQLQQFQISVVKKAMSFAKAEVIVYSTCSIHEVKYGIFTIHFQ